MSTMLKLQAQRGKEGGPVYSTKQPANLIAEIETRTNRTISISTNPDDAIARRKCDGQAQSPVFKLPQEVRDVIWTYVTAPYDDPTGKLEPSWRHPDRQVKQISSTGLLSTCRRIWLEANDFSLSQATLEFWAYQLLQDPRPGHARKSVEDEESRVRTTLRRLTPNNRRALQHIQLIGQAQGLFDFRGIRWHTVLGHCDGVCPRVLSILVRGADNLEERLGQSPANPQLGSHFWFDRMLNWKASPRLHQIRIELESENYQFFKIEQAVQTIKQRFKTVIRETSDGGIVRLELDDSVNTRMWIWDRGPHPLFVSVSTVKKLAVATLVWTVVPLRRGCEEKTRIGKDAGSSTREFDYASDGTITNAFVWRDQYHEKWAAEGSLLKFAPLKS